MEELSPSGYSDFSIDRQTTVDQNREINPSLFKKSYCPSSVAIFGGKLPEPMPPFIRFLFGAPLDSRDDNEREKWVGDSLFLAASTPVHSLL